MYHTTPSYDANTLDYRRIDPDTIALDEKTLEAERRSYHSFFDIHVVKTEQGYLIVEESDYGELPMHLIDDIVYTATGKMADDY